MEGSQLMAVRKFVKQTLNLSDGVKITDFSLQMQSGKLNVSAKISLEVNYEELSSASEVDTHRAPKRSYTPRCKPSIAPSRMPKPSGAYSKDRKFEATASDFHCIKVILRGWRKAERLNENELDVMAGYGGKFFTSMTAEDKANFLSFFHSVRTRLDQAEALSRK